MNGHASFNEVFLDQAKVPAAYLIGELGGGWTVALSILAHERRLERSGQRRLAGPVDPLDRDQAPRAQSSFRISALVTS